MLVKKVEDLVIYKIALQLAKDVDRLTEGISYRWNIREVDQIRRSSGSVSANITEGFSNRFYPRKYVHYLYIAMGSSDESKDHLEKLCSNGHISIDKFNDYLKRYKDLSIKILNMICYLRKRHQLKSHKWLHAKRSHN